MRKGMIFTMDAALALVVVMLLAATLPAQVQANMQEETLNQKLHQKALDRGISALYNQDVSGYSGPNEEAIDPANRFGECVEIHSLIEDPAASSLGARDIPVKGVFCEVAG
jgi:hypothetical protein